MDVCTHANTECCSVDVSGTSSCLALSSIHSPCIIHTHNCTVSYDSVDYSYHNPGAVMFWGMLVQWPPSPGPPISITVSDKARAVEGGEILASSSWLSTLLFSQLLFPAALCTPKPPHSWKCRKFICPYCLLSHLCLPPLICIPGHLASTGRWVKNTSPSIFKEGLDQDIEWYSEVKWMNVTGSNPSAHFTSLWEYLQEQLQG